MPRGLLPCVTGLQGLLQKRKQQEQLDELRRLTAQQTKRIAQEDYEWWNGLSYEEKLRAFRSVCRRIQQADIIEGGSYRHALYEVFGFEADSYADGMDCGYMDIHNFIHEGIAFRQGER